MRKGRGFESPGNFLCACAIGGVRKGRDGYHVTFLCKTKKMERLLSVSKELSDKIDSNEGAVNDLLKKCETLQQTVKAMIQVK